MRAGKRRLQRKQERQDSQAPATEWEDIARGIRQRCSAMSEADFLRTMVDLVASAIVKLSAHTEGQDCDLTYYPFRIELATWHEMQRRLFEVVDIVRTAKVLRVNEGFRAARADPAFQQFLAGQCIRD